MRLRNLNKLCMISLVFNRVLMISIERRRYKENHRRELRERRLDEEDSYYDRTNRKKCECDG